VKSPQQLLDIYYQSVGRNCILLLNLPPDRRGLIPEQDVASLLEFKSILDETFSKNLASGAGTSSSSTYKSAANFASEFLTDGDLSTFWAADEKDETAEIQLVFDQPLEFDRILLQEPVLYGQRISAFRVESKAGNEWKVIAKGTTIGMKRLLKTEPVVTNQIKIVIEDALLTPALSEIGLFKSSKKEINDLVVL
jgi:alpha-L-fucosidase